MKLRRFLAATAAAAVVTSAMAVAASAAEAKAFSNSATVNSTGGWWDQVDLTITDLAGDVDPATITKIVFTTDNAVSVQWNNPDYQKVDLAANGTVDVTDATYSEDLYFFALAVSSGDATYKATVNWDVYADDELVVDAPVEDEPVEDVPADDVIVEAPADGIDWAAYDADAMAALNADFVFGTTDQIDLYALVGDNWADLAKIEGTFVWTDLAAGWCGGGGLGGGAVLADGSNWLSGPEYGAANGNAAVVGDGVATQTIIDITENPLSAIATYDEETGETSFGKLFVQNWWNGVESGAQLAALTAYDAEGNVIGEIEYMEVPEAPAADDTVVDTDAPAADTGKDSPDTGVEGIAAVAGVVALAGVAVVASRKRK